MNTNNFDPDDGLPLPVMDWDDKPKQSKTQQTDQQTIQNVPGCGCDNVAPKTLCPRCGGAGFAYNMTCPLCGGGGFVADSPVTANREYDPEDVLPLPTS